ncbi:MAG: glycoside hydrolase family 9 protein, partial [Bacteroidota bacterium]
REANTNTIVYTANRSIWNAGATHNQSGDRGWWFDFSTLETVGAYYIYDPTNDERSAVFDIAPNIYHDVVQVAGKMFYYNRCNAPKVQPYVGTNWTDGNNFPQDANTRYIFDPSNIALEKDLTGGWFDAGDYNKYVTFTFTTLHDLLWAYRENPTFFAEDWNIPESGNGLPDILDEIKWELDWLLKMTNANGSVHIKMGSRNYAENSSYPPSANTDTRYYGPTCTAASISNASVFAHAAKVFAQFPTTATYAVQLENAAVQCWNYALPFLNTNTLETACDMGEIIAGDADWDVARQRENALVAAVHLYDLTRETSYENYVATYYNDAEMVYNTFMSTYKLAVQDALLLYTKLPNVTVSVRDEIVNIATTEASNNWNAYYGFDENNHPDLYRAFMPDWSYHWGSCQASAGYGVLNLQLVKYSINSADADSYRAKAKEMLHYFHGVNPLGMVYLSNMYNWGAERSANEIYHSWFHDGSDWDNALTSLYGPAPGFVVGGPNANFSVATLSPPAGQPMQKAYLDYNTSNPDKSWEITEPAIYYQATYLRLAANISNRDIQVRPKVYLQASYNGTDLNASLSTANLLPLVSPFGDNKKTINNNTLQSSSIVDWVWVEIRDQSDNTNILAAQSGLLTKDGQVVDTDGYSPLHFPLPPSDYYVAVQHRNHLGVMTSMPIQLE